jgi:hypothetical protein
VPVGEADHERHQDADIDDVYALRVPAARVGIITLMLLYGEWVSSNLGLGAVFVLVLLGATALGWWVVRGDRLNRQTLEEPPPGPEEGRPERHE